ncbi:hypothetical protein NT6N_18400 [Oceaniferula spumae]|uniref:Response regulatory domain-containing protein n=1 Tax=Oceaniferula spumae TaxID=2979115 RepID=A0AAT9FLF1_9BACT
MIRDDYIPKKRILIVDDEPSLLIGIEMALIGEDRDVFCLSSGQEALDDLEKNQYDLIVLDLNMPGLTGLDVLRELRQRGDRTKVIICSAHITERAMISAVCNGVVDFLAKPMSLTGLRDFVSYALDKNAKIKSELDDVFDKVRSLEFERALELLENEKVMKESGPLATMWAKLLRVISKTPVPANNATARKYAKALLQEAVIRC